MITHFQETNKAVVAFEEWFFRNTPAHAHGRKEAISFLRLEPVGTIVGAIEIEQVFLFIVIASLRRKSPEVRQGYLPSTYSFACYTAPMR